MKKLLSSNKATRYTSVNADVSTLAQGRPTLQVRGSTLKPRKISDTPGADEPITYLIEGLMQDKTFNSIVGPSKSGKSFFALQMAFCIQNGLSFLGYPTHKHHTLIVDFELKPNIIKQRVDNAKSYYNLPNAEEPDYLSIAEDFENGAIDMDDVITAVTDSISRDPDLKLVIFDCFYKFCKGARNQEENVKSQLIPLKALAETYGVNVVYVTHTSKGSFGKDPSVNDIINAAGGSGVHGKIVDATYVVRPAGRGNQSFIISTGGRCSCFGDIPVKRSPESYNFFTSRNEDIQEVIVPDKTLCKEILDYIESTGYKNEKIIRNKFHVTVDDLRLMHFIVDTKTHKISYDRSVLALPHEEPAEYCDEDDLYDKAV